MKNRSHALLYASGLFGLFAVWVSSMNSLGTRQDRNWVSLILVSIAVLFLLQNRFNRYRYGNWIRTTLQTFLAGCLFLFETGWTVFPIVFFILSPQVMMDFPIKIGIVWLVVFTLITGVTGISVDGMAGLIDLLPYTAGYVFFAFFGWTMMQAENERKRSEQFLAELKKAHGQLQRYTEQVEELTIAGERNRIAREMHDTLGHRLTIAAVQLEGAQRLISSNPQKVEQIIRTVHEQVKEGLTELRRTVAMMRAPVDDDLPLVQALNRLATSVREATGITIHLVAEEELPALPSSHRNTLFRAAQEGLTNIERHASASEAWIRLTHRDNCVSISIEDNGVGIQSQEEKDGLGLTGMRERAELLNGKLEIEHRVMGGTRLCLSLPLSEKSQL